LLIDALLATAEDSLESATIADPFRSIGYRDLMRFADVMRRQVEEATQRAHVGLMMPSSVAFAGTFYGILWAGRTVVPLNFLLQPAELAAVVADAGLDTIFTIRHFAEQLAPLGTKIVVIDDLPLKREMIMERVRSRPDAPRASADDLAILLYTSGTSGTPKGVCQTYGNITSDVDACITKAQLKAGHRFLGVLPLFHSFGLTAMLLVPVKLGASIYYLPRFQPGALFETIREQKSSVTMMIASMYAAMLRSKKGTAEDLASIEFAMSGGEALPPAVHAEFLSRFKVDVLQGYGMTEASPVVSLNAPWANKTGSVGQAIPGVDVQAFDDAGQQLGAGMVGELWVKGPIVMRGYYEKEAETRAVLTDDGWYKTGDMGNVDRDGYITITGRKKEMIIVGGENVYPREIENVLDAHPAVAESAVIGQMDASRGEVVIGFVTLREGQTVTDIALRDFCRDKIAGYKIPRRIIIASDLPRGPTGKILKRKLHELL
jgi:long-chain acyl-CoA synthetase